MRAYSSRTRTSSTRPRARSSSNVVKRPGAVRRLGRSPRKRRASTWPKFLQRTLAATPCLQTTFSIGSGTKLALEDAIALADCWQRNRNVAPALAEFERSRKPIIDAYQQAAYSSLLLFENAAEEVALDPVPLAYKLMTRSKKIDY